ncbi:hypothetical protein F53441_14245 [Fusarium austroafricanum]|uniref:Uncharacterized protein n=1 Tax=Fusarium austroafricanum TaxID=2364996 RepID=A0A8H4JFW5_9HYPO|nr:hypothetical protein F53441_14245 [Fusarium austroafricanum]
MSLREPSERERRMYYYGLPSCPKLVARSSSGTRPWSSPFEWPHRKELSVATGHKMQQPWNDPQGSLEPLIINALTCINWSAIDILCVGFKRAYEDPRQPSEHPVTMLISVPKNSTSFRQAEKAIIACRAVLVRFQLDDVEVEIKESIVSAASSNPGPATSSPGPATSDPTAGRNAPSLHPGPFDNDMKDIKYKFNRDLSEYMGTSIASSSESKEGTKGLYLQSNNGKTYALTCRHVLFSETDCEEYRYRDGNDTKHVHQPGKGSLNRIVADLKEKKEAMDQTIEEMAKPFYKTPEYQANLSDFLRQQTSLQSCQPRVAQFDNERCAVLGRVEFSPPIERCSQDRRLRDWALIELSQDSFATRLSVLRNKVPVTLGLQSMVNEIPGLPRPRQLRFSASLELAIGPSIIPESELDGTILRNIYGDTSLVVIKHGLTTGFTIGHANGIHSVTRRVAELARETISREWCVIGLHSNAFSQEGDSGACVFDLEGRIAGMMTAGLESEDNPHGYDVTYVTPMQWLLDDIKRQGYDVKLPN